jgi:signal transduction histidine kinase
VHRKLPSCQAGFDKAPSRGHESAGVLSQKFYRVHDPATKTAKGPGVGLYLVRRFVELQGGVVGVEGEYKSWIAFWFKIPDGVPGAAP